MKSAVLSCFVSLVAVLGLVCGNVVLENDLVSFSFDESTGDIVALIDKRSKVDVVGSASRSVPLVDFVYVDSIGSLTQGTLKDVVVHQSKDPSTSSQSVSLTWPKTPLSRGSTVVAHANLTLTVSLSKHSYVADWAVSSTIVDETTTLGLWDVTVSLPVSVGGNEDGELFYPAGYGYIYSDPVHATGGAHAKTYPGGETSMQFMALGSKSSPAGAYFAAADEHGAGKLLQYSTRSGKMRPSAVRGSASWNKYRTEKDTVRPLHWSDAHSSSKHASDINSAPSSSTSSIASALSIVLYVPDAGLPLTVGSTWTAPYSFSVGVVSDVNPPAGRPLWSQAAQIYKDWSLHKSDWTKLGPIRDPRRQAQYPKWFLNNNIWLNTHWQCHDIFNATGGDPNYVSANTEAVANRLRQKGSSSVEPVLLHWYEWQQGPSPKEEDRYLFDTHYPDYFPARMNFQQAVASLAKKNVLTFPYINGRISDINSNAYLAENGIQYCTKSAPKALVDPANPPTLTPYVETYGSNATFCVTNPFTSYWQNKLAETCRQLVDEDNVAGVYIDQIGSAVPKLCFDTTHNHTLGGGTYWAEGYAKMMETISSQVKKVSPAQTRPMVTEDNAEPYLTMVQGLLTLNAFKAWYSDDSASPLSPKDKLLALQLRGRAPAAAVASTRSTSTAGPHVAPAFPLIYGGYFVGFGAIWTRADFSDKNWWSSKLATMFVTGTQLGWFSIAGRNDDTEDSCGPMGVGDLIMDPANDDIIDYFHVITKTRSHFIQYMTHGHVASPPALTPAPAVHTFVSTFDGSSQQYSSVLYQAWQLPADVAAGSPVIAILAGASSTEAYTGSISVDPVNWWPNASSHTSYKVKVYAVTTADVTEEQAAASPVVLSESLVNIEVASSLLQIDINVPTRSCVVLEITANL